MVLRLPLVSIRLRQVRAVPIAIPLPLLVLMANRPLLNPEELKLSFVTPLFSVVSTRLLSHKLCEVQMV